MWSPRRKGEDDAAPLDGLENPASSPDLTAPIMDRLGYHPITSRQSRRRRSMMWIGRAATMSVVLAVVAVGVQVQLRQPDPRRPIGPTLHEAFERDVDLHREQLNSTIRTIRGFSITPALRTPVLAPPSESTPVEPIGEDEPDQTQADSRTSLVAPWV